MSGRRSVNGARGTVSDQARDHAAQRAQPARQGDPRDPQRLQHLYEVSKVLTVFEGVEETVCSVLSCVARTLPLRSVILLLGASDSPRVIAWKVKAVSETAVRPALLHAYRSYPYLVGPREAVLPDSVAAIHDISEVTSALEGDPRGEETAPGIFVVLPLVVCRAPIFGALQIEGAARLDESDLAFVNAVVNQLALAIDRHAAMEKVRAVERTRREESERALNQRQDVLAMVSHDLRNPLFTILMTTQLLLSTHASTEASDDRRKIDLIRRSAERMRRLIQDLLDVSSIDAGRYSLNVQRTLLAPMFAEIIDLVRPAAAANAMSVHTRLVDEGLALWCDPTRVVQVLLNLVDNAIKFSHPGASVQVSAELRPPGVFFQVRDTGPGLAPESLAHVFERHWQAPETASKGTGLGLYISKEIVEAHGGSIGAESTVGAGSTFFFTLPISPAGSSFPPA